MRTHSVALVPLVTLLALFAVVVLSALSVPLAVAPAEAATSVGSGADAAIATGSAAVGGPGLVSTGAPVPLDAHSGEPTDAGRLAGPDAGQRADPDADPLGWEGGYWHDESLSVTPGDGYNDSELEAVVARTAARVEVLRDIEFEALPEVSVIDREAYRERLEADRNTSTANRLHQNVKLEALFFAGEETDALEIMRGNQASSTLGFYQPSSGEIVIVSADGDPTIDENTLAHELVHALQDQRFDAFDAEWYPGATREAHNAADGVIEGDAGYVDYLHERRCGDEWSCLSPGSGGGGETPNLGYALLQYAPYSDGAVFVQQRHDAGGWAAVNELYDEPTASTEQYIHPERYPDDVPREIALDDRSTDAWVVPDVPGGVDHAELGEAGLFVMLWYPSYVAEREVIVSPVIGQSSPDVYDYAHPASAGWDGDRLLPYVTDDSAETNETGYVWRIGWDGSADAAEFRDAYEELLGVHGGERVGERTWQLDDDRSELGSGTFADAFHVTVEGDTVTIVNAPTVDDLSEIRGGADSQSTTDDAGSGDGGSIPGFGAGIALTALAAVVAALASLAVHCGAEGR